MRRVADLQDPRERWIITALVVPMTAAGIVSRVAEAISPTLLVNSPLLLVFMNPGLRFVILAAPQVDFLPFLLVVVGRLIVTDPLFFIFGYRYGEAGIRWVEEKSGAPGALSWIERWFRKAAYPLIVIMPNSLICVLSGASGLSIRTFVVLNLGGTVARVALIWWLGDIFREPLLDVVDFVADYQWWFTAGTFILTFAWLMWAGRKGRLGLETPGQVEDELEEFQSEIEGETDVPAPEGTGGAAD
jgi:membrane protein DedA with SNARE-associated domain